MSLAEDIDYKFFKALISSQGHAIDFVNSYSINPFLGDVQDIAGAALEYVKRYKQPPTKNVLKELAPNLSSKIDDVYDRCEVTDYNSTEYKFYLDKIKERHVSIKSDRLKSAIAAGASIKDIDREIKEIRQIEQPNRKAALNLSLDQYLPEFHKDYSEKIRNPEYKRGILTGYSFLDSVTNGIAAGELYIIGGATASGKSMMLNNIALQIWMQQNNIASHDFTTGFNVLYFSLEMPYEPCFHRTMARLADVPSDSLRDACLSKSEAESVTMASRFIKKYPNKFNIVDLARGATIDDIEQQYLEASKDREIHLVAVDYLGLMELDEDGDDWLKLGKIAGQLHEFTRSYKTRCVTAVQLNRAAKDKAKDSSELVGVHRIGRSSLIMHHANVGIQIEDRKDEGLRDDFVYHVIKNRSGRLGSHTIRKMFAHGAIFDVPFAVPGGGDFGSYDSAYNGDMDISKLLEIQNG